MSEQSQSNRFAAHLLMCLPEMTVGERQEWLNDPARTKEFLTGFVPKRWTEKDGVITFTLPPTDGATGPEWISRIWDSSYRVGLAAKHLLVSPDFRPTTGMIYTVKVLKGELFAGADRTIKNAWAKASELSFGQLNAEAACLIRKNFTDQDLEAMGLLWIAVMHEPIRDAEGVLRRLAVGRGLGGRWLHSDCYDNPDSPLFDLNLGFAFAASPAGAKA